MSADNRVKSDRFLLSMPVLDQHSLRVDPAVVPPLLPRQGGFFRPLARDHRDDARQVA